MHKNEVCSFSGRFTASGYDTFWSNLTTFKAGLSLPGKLCANPN